MRYVSRAEWGARAPRRVTRRNMSRPSTGHWNGPKVPSVDHSKCASQVRGIQNFHMDGRGWNDIAYNFVICQHGYVFEGRGLNVTNGANGTNQGNFTSHAVMWLDGQGNDFTQAEKQAFLDCVRYISDKTDAPNDAIGHRDHKSTECPGNERYNWIRSSVPGSGGANPTPSGPSAPTGLPTLRRGDKGPHVRVVQTVIRNKAGGNITVDGDFGPQTERRVKDLQKMFKLKADGIVGPNTWAVIKFLNAR